MELEETIKYIENIINATYITATLKDKDGNIIEEGLVNQQVIQDLLDLYNKEKQEKNCLIKNSIPKKKIEEVKKKIKKAMNLANECIEEKIVIADSDSLNFGRKQAHNYDMELIRELLEDK